jgi:hypothetical protein
MTTGYSVNSCEYGKHAVGPVHVARHPGQVFIAADQPYGMIEGCVLRDKAAPPGLALGQP